jgi:tetratricopeptide (TPR) repeat protein
MRYRTSACADAGAAKPDAHGKVVKLREGSSDPVANANVTLEQSGKMVTTNSAGLFFMPLPAELQEGEEIRFGIDVPGYAVFEPAEGRSRIPHELRKDIVMFGLLPKSSPKFFSHEHLTMLLRGAAEKSTEQVREQGHEKAVPDLSRYLKDWAVQYGFGVEQVKAEVDRWISEVDKKQDNIYELGLAAFARNSFAEAGNLFQESAQQNERKLLETREHEKHFYEQTIRDYRLAGDAHYNAYDFRKAMELYEKALSLADRQRTPQLWAAILWTAATRVGGSG